MGATEFLFQPIAEDEPGLDDIEAIIGPQSGVPGPDDTQWRTLPTFMEESCHLGGQEGRESPPPPAPRDPDIDPSGARQRKPSDSNSDNMDTLSPT